MSRVRELTFNIDTLSDVDLSGVNTTLRHLSTKKRPVEPRHIVDFSAISRPDDRTVILRVTLDEGIFIADTTSPRNGKNFITGHAPEVATVVMSNALDPNLNGTVKFDSAAVPSAQVTLDGQHVLKIDLATAFPSTYNAVGGHTIEVSGFADIEGNPQTQDEVIGYAVDPLASSIDTGEVMPYTANLKTGILRCSRLVMERGANIEEQLTRYLRQRGMDREHILHQSLVTTHKATLELYVLYLESVNPRLLKSFPNQGSTLSLSNPPTTYFFTFSAPLSLQCIQNNQSVLYDGTYVGDANVSLTPDEQTLVVDISGLAGANTAGLHSFELTDLCGVDGVNFTSVPTYIDVTVAEVPDADANAGGGSTNSFGTVDADGTNLVAVGDDTLVMDSGNGITISGDNSTTTVTVTVDESQISHDNIADNGTLTHPQIDAQIGQLQTDVGTNTTDIGTNTTNIGTNTTAITNLDNDLTAHTGASNPHGTTIVDLDDTPAVAANTDEILRWNGSAWVFVTDLTDLETAVTTNTGNIGTNTGNISTNASNIGTNTTNITTNTSAIAVLQTDKADQADLNTTNTNVGNNTTAINNHIADTSGNPHQVTLEEARSQNNAVSGPIILPSGDPTLSTHAAHKGYVDSEISAIPSAPVIDVNGQTGNVLLDADHIDDTSTAHKFVSAAEKTAISTAVQSVNGVSGTTPVIDPDDLDDASTAHKFVSQSEKDDIATALQPGDQITELTNNANYVTTSGVTSVNGDSAAAVLIGIQDLEETFLPVTNGTNTGKVLEWNGTAWILGAEKLTPTGDGSGLTGITPGQVGADPAGTDNSTDVTLAGTPNYITISATGQIITRNPIDLTTDVTNDLPVADGGTGASNAADARTNLGVDVAGTDNSTPVTLTGTPDYITISGQQITRNQIDLANHVTGLLPQVNVDGLVTDISEKDALIDLLGVTAGDTDLGTFTQGIVIPDNQTVKDALAALDEALSGSLPVVFDVHNQSGADIAKGTPVYVSGTHTSGKPTVAEADANGVGTNPAVGLVYADIADGNDGIVALSGILTNLDTSSYASGAALYVSETAGDLTITRPTATNTKVQKVGLVTRVHATAGSILVIGAGRSNDINNELVTLTGVALNESDLGAFTGATILDNRNIKQALQDLETETEQKIEFTDLSAGGDLTYDGSGGFSFTERTNAEVRGLVSVTDTGGDGSLSYDSGTGIITYTGPSEGEVRTHIDTAFVDGLNVDAATLDGSVKADFATASHNHSLVSLDDVATGVSPSNNNQVLVWSTSNGGEWILADLDDKADASAITNFIVGTDVPSHETNVTVSGENYISEGGTNGHGLTASAIDLGTTHVTGTLPVSRGGTGATTEIGARNSLGLGTSNTPNFSGVTVGAGLVDVVLDDDVRLDAATTSQDGLLSTTDKTRLDDLHNNTANYITSAGAPVQSVNSQTGAVSLDADDIPEAATTPTNLYFTDARADDRIAAANIEDLSNVSFNTGVGTARGDVLYNDGTGWTNLEHPLSGTTRNVAVATGGSGSEAINYVTLELDALDDVVLGTEAENHVLYYDNSTKEWKNRAYTAHLSDVFDTASATANKVIQWNNGSTPGWELIDTPSGSSVGTIGDLTNVNTSVDSLTNTAGDIGKTITWTGTEFQAQKNEASTDAVEAQGFFFG